MRGGGGKKGTKSRWGLFKVGKSTEKGFAGRSQSRTSEG